MRKYIAAVLILLLLTVNVSAASSEAEKRIKRLDMTEQPAKTEYLQGEELDLNGLYLTVTYEDGQKENVKITADMISGYDAQKLGAQVIVVRYSDRATSFSVKVVAEHSDNETAKETLDFDTSPETRPAEQKEGEPNKAVMIIAVAVCAVTAALCIAAIIIKPKKEVQK